MDYTNVVKSYLKPTENILHDIKMPLTIIYSKIQCLEDNQNLSGEVQESLDVIKKSWFRVMKLLNDIKDSEKLVNGEINPHYSNIDIVLLLEYIVDISSSLAYRKNINIEFVSNIDSCIAAVDKEIIERILLNLISNSIKYSDEGSLVVVDLFISHDTYKIAVKDNGIGICENKIENIFERYVRGEHTESGLGIGLNIVKEFVDLLDGSIFATSSKNGTEIAISLPRFLTDIDADKLKVDNFYSYNIFEIELSDDYNI